MQYMSEVNRVGSLMNSLIISGMLVSAVGLVPVFAEWTHWLVSGGSKLNR
jgi:hypothetical protein